MQVSTRSVLAGVVLVCLLGTTEAAAEILRVANWNVGNQPNTLAQQANMATVFGHIGSQSSGPLDLLVLAETDTTSVADTAAVLMSTYGGSWSFAATAPDTGGDRTGFVWNTDSFSLVSSATVGTGTMTHPALRGQFRPVGGVGDDVYVYATHLKAGATLADIDQRWLEAQTLRADADALGSSPVIYAGDFNWISAFERLAGPGAWQALTGAGGEGQAFDPASAEGNWRDNLAFLHLHTQDPGAAMDDRFDVQMLSEELRDGMGFDWIPGSYRVVGNNATHVLNGAITTGSGAPAGVLAALATFDHLPVVLDYQLIPEPGTMLVLVAAGGLLLRRHRVARLSADPGKR